MLPPVPGIKLHGRPWRELTFDRVLQYYDGPRLLLRRVDDGQLYLAWWSDADESTERWLYLPLTQPRLWDVLSGELPSRTALNTPENGYVLVIDVASDTDTIIDVVRTNASALPQDTIPLPGARLSISEPASGSLRANLDEVISKQPPYDYDPGAGTVAVPKVEILRLHEGASAAAATIKQQLAALEAIGVSVIVGANGPSADDLNDYIRAVSSFGEIGQLMRPSPHLYIGKIDVPVVQVTPILRGMQGANRAVDKLSDLMAAHQLLDESSRLLAFHADNWAQAWHVVASLDSFIQSQSDISSAPRSTPMGVGPADFQRLFQEYGDLAPLSSISKLLGPVSDAGVARPDVVRSTPNVPPQGQTT